MEPGYKQGYLFKFAINVASVVVRDLVEILRLQDARRSIALQFRKDYVNRYYCG